MKNIKHSYKIVVNYYNNLVNSFDKYFKYLFNKILLKYKNIIKNNSNKSKSKISNFNKTLITFISLLFIYLFYLSIPTLYNKSWVQNTLEKKLINQFKLNFSISSEISYEILPSPHFKVKNALILNGNDIKPKELSEIKELKIFINQKNFFKKENLEIKKISIIDANFSIQRDDLSFFDNLINNKLAMEKIDIKKGNIFYKDQRNNIISLIKILRLNLFYDDLKLLNIINLKGEVFKLPFTLKINKEISEIGKQSINLKSKKINLNILNESKKDTKNRSSGLNVISIFSSKFNTKYNYTKKLITFNSYKSLSSNYNVNYDGKLSLEPFDFIININLENLKASKLVDPESIYMEVLKNDLLFNKNISAKILINSIENNNKLFDFSKIILNINNGKINLDQTSFINKDVGELEIANSNLFLQNNDLIFNTDINIEIKDSDRFYSLLQTPKKSRKKINKILINLDYSLYSNKVVLNNVKFDDIEPSKNFQDLISILNAEENYDYRNFIKNKNLLNKLFDAYSG